MSALPAAIARLLPVKSDTGGVGKWPDPGTAERPAATGTPRHRPDKRGTGPVCADPGSMAVAAGRNLPWVRSGHALTRF